AGVLRFGREAGSYRAMIHTLDRLLE
ncbi:MAG: hypothetical protein QOG77_12, partial [Solirubrobacteraceae bacterium]|nr:hypothetical protein [Solirubrobacteraceae bacterium]